MKSTLNISLCALAFLVFQACGSVPQQPVSHLGDGGGQFGSGTVNQSFDQQSELTSPTGFAQSEPEQAVESSFDQNNNSDIGIILIPVSIHDGFSLSYSTLRFCRIVFKQSCSHLASQVRQPHELPKAPVSLPDGAVHMTNKVNCN